jgi:nicotinamidase/pyrazinamidase
MADHTLVFVDVDTQRDFLAPSGSLFIGGSTAILANLARLTRAARERSIPVIATACCHTLDEVDPEPFPPHCLAGTEGQHRIEETDWPGGTVLSPDATLANPDHLPTHLTLEKTRYDVFSRPDASAILSLYARGRPTFVVYGVATDYCVRAVVLGLRELGHEVEVVVDAVWAIDAEHEADQFADFVAHGAALTLTDAFLDRRRVADRSVTTLGSSPRTRPSSPRSPADDG